MLAVVAVLDGLPMVQQAVMAVAVLEETQV
jgi:hypothetical protein